VTPVSPDFRGRHFGKVESFWKLLKIRHGFRREILGYDPHGERFAQ
jgi:hypothetical protein